MYKIPRREYETPVAVAKTHYCRFHRSWAKFMARYYEKNPKIRPETALIGENVVTLPDNYAKLYQINL